MQHLEVSGAVRPLYGSLGVKGLMFKDIELCEKFKSVAWFLNIY